MSGLLQIEDARSRVDVAAELGGGIAAFDALTAAGAVPVLRPWGGAGSGVFGLASNVLVPFSNRISGGGFSFEGCFHPIEPNLEGEPFPIHGDGFQRPWSVLDATPARVTLALDEGAIGPFRYAARQSFTLTTGDLTVELSVRNTGDRALPFGGGFHPWLPREAGTRIRFDAAGVWLEDERHLPTRHIDFAEGPEWDFATARTLPEGLINNAYTGWTGEALVTQPGAGIEVRLSGTPELDVAIVYSPGVDADFFCFEPVSHAVDAHNRDTLPGLWVLTAGESLSVAMTIGWSSL